MTNKPDFPQHRIINPRYKGATPEMVMQAMLKKVGVPVEKSSEPEAEDESDETKAA